MEYRLEKETGKVYSLEQATKKYLPEMPDAGVIRANFETWPIIGTIQSYDSEADTLKHIKRVSSLLNEAAIELLKRANVHDDSKLQSPEKELFDEWTPILKNLKYGTNEYNASLNKLKVALNHHYENNSHHPEHYLNGINGFDLFDLVEMFFDWKAATERTKDGNIYKSIEFNRERFKMDPQICAIFVNTAKKLNY
jgi:hypothetical protein